MWKSCNDRLQKGIHIYIYEKEKLLEIKNYWGVIRL